MSLWGESEAEVSIIEEETGERGRLDSNSTDISIFRALSFSYLFFYLEPPHR